MGVKEVADKYIARDGSPVKARVKKERPLPTSIHEVASGTVIYAGGGGGCRDGGGVISSTPTRLCVAGVDDIHKVAAFLAWHGDSDLWGGVHSDEAWAAFCNMVGLPADEFRRMFRGS